MTMSRRIVKVILQAVLDDNHVVVRLLLLNGADVNKPDVDGYVQPNGLD